MNAHAQPEWASKVPEVTLVFWLIKVAATTLGETGGDAVSMSWLGETTSHANGSGYLIGTAIFALIFAGAAWAQISARRFHPALYWSTVIASTMVGTTLADYVTRSLGIGYSGGSLLLLTMLLGALWMWRHTTGTVSVTSVTDARSERFYWLTILCSQTLGTALGDWVADTAGLGYTGGILIFGGLLAGIAVMHYRSKVSPTLLFWVAFILTRPLGAVLGDFLDKPIAQGGLALSRYGASAALLAFIVGYVLIFRQHAIAAIPATGNTVPIAPVTNGSNGEANRID